MFFNENLFFMFVMDLLFVFFIWIVVLMIGLLSFLLIIVFVMFNCCVYNVVMLSNNMNKIEIFFICFLFKVIYKV